MDKKDLAIWIIRGSILLGILNIIYCFITLQYNLGWSIIIGALTGSIMFITLAFKFYSIYGGDD